MSEDLLRDLAMYKNYKDKSVIMAARTLIGLFREQMPTLLHKKDRGRPTEASVEIKPKKYGEVIAVDHIPGAEALLKESTKKYIKKDDGESDSDGWEDVEQSDDGWESVSEDEGDGEATGSGNQDGWVTDSEPEGSESEEESEDEDEGSDSEIEEVEPPTKARKPTKSECSSSSKASKVSKKSTKSQSAIQVEEPADPPSIEAVKEIALTKIFTDEDFSRIEGEMLRKKVTNARKRKAEEPIEKSEFVKLNDIEMIYKKRRTDKQARVDSMQKGREGREKYGYKDGRHSIHCSKTNREKQKNKNFMMMRHKARGKAKKSFRDKQLALRKHLTQQKKMK
jgi:protein SDA1